MNQTLILITDDDDDDRYFVRQALERHIHEVSIKEAKDGQEAISRLFSSEEKSDFSVVILDVNMPIMNGLETLKAIRATESLRRIPVVMLSTSDSPDYVKLAYEQGANSYIKKPTKVTKYDDIAKAIDCCFLSVKS